MNHRGDPQSRLFDEIALHSIPQLRHALRSQPRLNGDAGDLADPVCGGEREAVQRNVTVHE